jgi:hypothetical protein
VGVSPGSLNNQQAGALSREESLLERYAPAEHLWMFRRAPAFQADLKSCHFQPFKLA